MNSKKHNKFTRRVLMLGVMKIALVSILVGRFYYLQVLSFTKFQILSDRNKLRIFRTFANRGIIVDRNLLPLADTIKKYSFSAQRKTHGQGDTHRHVGSIGAASDPSRVFPGKKMPGRYGNKTVSVKNLEVVGVNESKNQLLVKGSVPGSVNGIIYVTR